MTATTFNRLLLTTVGLAAHWALAAEPGFTAEARAKYEEAAALVQSARYAEAITALNALAAEYPRVAEVFATRCSAQLGQGKSPGAEADCSYAVTLKPSLSSALYGLALAEDNQGKPAALEHYRRYLAQPDVTPGLGARATARVNALSAAQPLAVAAPPPPPGAAAAVAAEPAPASAARGTLYIYRNHFIQNGNLQVTLLVDDKVVGDIAHDHYVEVQLPAGDHTVEACIGGIRYRGSGGQPFLEIHAGGVNGQWGASLGSNEERRERLSGITVPVEVPANGQTYVNFDHAGGTVLLQQIPPEQAVREIHDDCRKAYTKKL